MLNRYNRVIALGILLFIVTHAFGQNNTSSPYSMYGIGELGSDDFGRNVAMGGLSTPLYSPFHLNPDNPASYTALGTNSFIFEIGATAKYLMLKIPNETYDDFGANFSYIAIGFPITKWWKSGIGLVPLTNIGYNIEQVVEMEYDASEVITTYRGEGGITNFYFDNSFKILKSLSVGFKLSYMFGPLIYNESSTSYNENSTSIVNRQDKANINSFAYKTGIHFHRNITEKLFVNIGATYGLNSDLEAKDHLFITTAVSRSNGFFIDTLIDETLHVGVLQIPQSFSFGISTLINKKLELGIDYSKALWSESVYFDKNQNLTDQEKFSFGGEYTPDLASVSYVKTIRYRFGANFSKSYLLYEGTQLQNYGMAFGVGLPIKRTPSVMNFAVSYNKRYIPGIDILTENYIQFQFNMSLHAIWFKKRVWE
ncbi:MAG: hypothetical protein DRI95_11810 [Bacteroidetes bacterium]|nr:MAG: hypothetical protein DRI95_11810 [Bacteroidota bacterium]RLD85405.1 MAG: hypothetical protein DRJ07_03085 [Bacteroidota bacterium]